MSALPSGRLDGFTRTRLHIPFEPSVPTAGPDSAPAHDNPRLSHARYYAELARTAARRIAEGDQYAGITAFRSEERNIRCALDTLIGVGAADEAIALVDHARTYWYASGAPFTWAERLTALPETPADTPRRTRLNLLLAEAAIRAGEPEAALALLGQADADRAGVVGGRNGGTRPPTTPKRPCSRPGCCIFEASPRLRTGRVRRWPPCTRRSRATGRTSATDTRSTASCSTPRSRNSCTAARRRPWPWRWRPCRVPPAVATRWSPAPLCSS
ncbi:hypothetical protein SAZ11_52515 [Streptomyces sp. FXJ1.4098]|nr:hypothetical protein [Streptomyces sp. FXJ1.4098]